MSSRAPGTTTEPKIITLKRWLTIEPSKGTHAHVQCIYVVHLRIHIICSKIVIYLAQPPFLLQAQTCLCCYNTQGADDAWPKNMIC